MKVFLFLANFRFILNYLGVTQIIKFYLFKFGNNCFTAMFYMKNIKSQNKKYCALKLRKLRSLLSFTFHLKHQTKIEFTVWETLTRSYVSV